MAKDNLKSARKKFMVMRIKNSIMEMLAIADDQVDVKLGEILASLTKTFGADQAQEILDDAIDGADAQFSGAIQNAIVETTKESMAKVKK